MSAVESIATPSAEAPAQPGPRTLVLIFWLAFAGAVVAAHLLDPALFSKQDPDSLMRLVQVRDLVAGQNWFDLVQHRLAPPDGVSMHWSRLIDAPIAGLFMIGGLFGAGEAFALAAWPLLLLLGFMAALVSVAVAFAGRPAVLPTLILSLTFFSPLLMFLPASVDHHNAQLVLLAATLAAAQRIRTAPLFGLAAGLLSATSLAVGLEMLAYVAVFGAYIALHWALTGTSARAAQFFALAFGAGPALLYVVAGQPEAAFACDALSWTYALPAAAAGTGLAAVITLARGAGTMARLLGLAVPAALAGATFVLAAPECLAGPYGFLSPELKRLWLSTITEAQPLLDFAAREPVGIIATLTAPAMALGIALGRARRYGAASPWTLPAVLVALAIALSFYQVRTLPAANALAIPVLGAWLAEIAAHHNIVSLRPLRRAVPLVAGFLLAMPLVHVALGWAALEALALATGIAPVARPDLPVEAATGRDRAQDECLDTSAQSLLAAVPPGQVLAPVFYGSAMLALSPHSAVAAPYHRGGAAILDAIHALDGTPAAARKIVDARGVDYVAICTTSRETALTRAEAPDGLLARLVSGEAIAWLDPVASETPTRLKLWRVRR